MSKQLRAKDCETEFGIGRFQVYKLVREKRIPHARIGRMIIFDRDELNDWFKKHKVPEVKAGK